MADVDNSSFGPLIEATAPAPAVDAPAAPAENRTDGDVILEVRPPRPPTDKFAPVDLDAPAKPKALSEKFEEVLDKAEKRREQRQDEPPPAKPTRPPDLPKSWATEDAELWAALPEEVRAKAAEIAEAREKHFHTRQAEIDKARQDAETLTKQLRGEQERALVHRQAADEFSGMVAQYNRQFGDLKEPADIEKLAKENPERFEQWKQSFTTLELNRRLITALQSADEKVLRETAAAVQQEQHKQAREHFAKYCEAEDQRAAKLMPELADPAQAEAVQERCLTYLTKDLGLPKERVVELWNTNPLFRSAEAQAMVADAAFGRAARKAAANARPVVQPPQRAGRGGNVGNGAVDLNAIAASGNMAAYIAARNRKSR